MSVSDDSKKPKGPPTDEPFEIESLNVDLLDVEELERRIELTVGLPMIPGDLGLWCDCNDYDPCSLCTDNTCSTYCSDCPSLCTSNCSVLNCLDSCTADDIRL